LIHSPTVRLPDDLPDGFLGLCRKAVSVPVSETPAHGIGHAVTDDSRVGDTGLRMRHGMCRSVTP